MKTQKTILVDMDGVLADIYPSYLKTLREDYQRYLTLDDCMGVGERVLLPDIENMLNKNHVFRHLPVMPGSIEGLRYLNEKYQVVIVSSATEFPNCLNDKQAWLQENFPFIHWEQMIFCGIKNRIMGDIMIDDHPKNLLRFPGQRIIFTQPHNCYEQHESYHRVQHWHDIMKLL